MDLDPCWRANYFESIFTTFEASFIFWGSRGSSKNRLVFKIEPALSNLACLNRWNTLYNNRTKKRRSYHRDWRSFSSSFRPEFVRRRRCWRSGSTSSAQGPPEPGANHASPWCHFCQPSLILRPLFPKSFILSVPGIVAFMKWKPWARKYKHVPRNTNARKQMGSSLKFLADCFKAVWTKQNKTKK